MSYDVEMNTDTIHVNLHFKDRVCFLHGNSGTGKTYMLSKIQAHCIANGEPFVNVGDIGVQSRDAELILNMCRGKNVVMFDRAEHYLTRQLLESVCALSPNLVIVCTKDVVTLSGVEHGEYVVEYTADSLGVRRVG